LSYLENPKKKIEYIINLTHKYYLECDTVSTHDNNNLVGLYFHEIVRYFSTAVLREAIENKRGDNSNFFLDDDIRFGYRNNLPIFIFNSISKKRRFISFFAKNPILSKRPTLFLGDVSINNYKIILMSYLKGYKVVYFDKKDKVFIDKFDLQLKILMNLVKNLCEDVNVSFNNTLSKDINDALSIVSSDPYPKKIFKTKDVVLIGTPGKLFNRIISLNAHFFKIKVIGVLHGDESGSENLAAWRYDDRSNCSHLLGYGPLGNYLKNAEENFKSLSGRDYSYIESDSEVCRAIYNKHSEISKLSNYSDLHNQNGLYISMQIRNVSAINTWPLFDPSDYIAWQKHMLKSFQNVNVKTHPKQKYYVDFNNNIEKRKNLAEIVADNDYDYYIIDGAASTAFSLIAASNKPIIYFNIGIPSYTDIAIKTIRDRVLWIDVDMESNYDGFEQFKNSKIKNNFSNNFTEMFSLASIPTSRVSALSSIL